MCGKRSLYAAITPLYYISKLSGLAPFSYSKNPNTDTNGIDPNKSFGIFSVLWSLLLTAIIISGFIISMNDKMSHAFDKMASKVIVADVCTSVLLFGTTISSLILGASLNRRKLWKILSKLSALDERLLYNKMANVYRKTFLFLIAEISAVFLFILLLYTVHISAYESNAITAVPEIMAHIVNLVNVLQFVDVELLLRFRYLTINQLIPLALNQMQIASSTCQVASLNIPNQQELPKTTSPNRSTWQQSYSASQKPLENEEMNVTYYNNFWNMSNQKQYAQDEQQNNRTTKQWEISSQKQTKSSAHVKNEPPKNQLWNISNRVDGQISKCHRSNIKQILQLRTLREMHSQLYDVVELVDFKFGFPILMELGCNFVSLVSTLYTAMTFMKSVQQIGDTHYMQKIMAFVFWTVLYLAKAGAVTISCHAASEEAAKSVAVVQKMLLDQNLAADLSTELHLYLTQLCNNRVDFTACGFFSVNLSLLHGIVGATATYIIILIQLN